MRNSVTLLQCCFPSFIRQKVNIFTFLILSFAFISPVWAESPQTAPSQLKQSLTQIDAAANSQQISAVRQFYSPNFTNSDGLNLQGMEKALTQLWQRYPKLNYRTELQSWNADGNAIVAETVTYITGTQLTDGRNIKLDATMRSRQRFQGAKIVQQEILSERSQLTSGSQPPTVEVNLPEQVRLGQEYTFDAIVKEPVGDDLLLGSVLEEPVRTDGYLKPGSYELESLPAGGIFKIGKAPQKAGNYWVSAVLVRTQGMTMVTQRLQVRK